MLLGSDSMLAVLVGVFVSIPLYTGILDGVLRRVREGRQMSYGDAFLGFRIFWRVAGAALLVLVIFLALAVVPAALIVAAALARSWALGVLGGLLGLAVGVAAIYLQVSWAYLFPVLVDRSVGVVDAMRESRRLVRGAGWWWTFAALLVLYLAAVAASTVLGLVPLAGSLAAAVLVYPFVFAYLVAMYFGARGEAALVDAVLAPAPPYAPPPQGVPAAPEQPGAPPQGYAPPQPAVTPVPVSDDTQTTAAEAAPSAPSVTPPEPPVPPAPPKPDV